MRYILLLLAIQNIIFAQNNQTIEPKVKYILTGAKYVNLGDIGSFLEPIFNEQSTHITILIILFTTFLTIIFTLATILAYFKGKSLIDSIEKNKDKIDSIKNSLESEIKEEVSKQIVYQTKELITKIENYAYRQIKTKLDEITCKEQSKLFKYQKLLFQMNEAKKLEYENVLNSSEDNEKLEKIIFIQNKYNEINNQTLPKLFSSDIKEITTAAIKLSEYKILKRVIAKFLKELLQEDKDKYTYAQKAQIESVLYKYYQ